MLSFWLKIKNFIDSKRLKDIKKSEKKAKKQEENKMRGNKKTISENFKEMKKNLIPLKFKDSKGKIAFRMLLRTLFSNILTILKWFFIFLISNMFVMLFFIAVVVIIIILILNGFLHMDFTVGDGDSYKGMESSECIQGSAAMSSIGYDFSNLGQLAGTLTDDQKNLLISAQIYNEILTGSFGDYTEKFNETYKSIVTDTKVALPCIMGFMSIENGFHFSGSSNILTTPMNTSPDVNNDAWFGLEAEKKDFDGKYEGNTFYSDSFVSKFKEKYHYNYPSSDMISCYNYGPYGIATQLGVLSTYFKNNSSVFDYIKTKVPEVAKEYGINSNIDKLTTYCSFFMAANCYHGRSSSMTDPNIHFWCALWASTSDVDSERDFNKIKLNTPKGDYTESTLRPEILGKSSYPGTYGGKPTTISNLTYIENSSVSGYIEINGQKLTVPLIQFVKKYCESKGYSASYQCVIDDLNGRAYASTLGTAVLNQNYSYGLVAFLNASKVISDLGVSTPIVTGGSSAADCECFDTGSVFSINIDNVQKGVIQGPWDSETKEYMKTNGSDAFEYFGRTYSMEHKDEKNTHSSMPMTYEEWRNKTKWNVPFFIQGKYVDTGFGVLDRFLSSLVNGDNGLAQAGCHIFMYSYMASSLTGTVITPTEMTLGLRKEGGITQTGLNSSGNAVKTYHNLGLKAVSIPGVTATPSGDVSDLTSLIGADTEKLKSTTKENLQSVIDSVLSKNGLVGYAACSPLANGKNHYVVISEKVGSKYRIVWYGTKTVYSAENYDLFTFDQIFDTMFKHGSYASEYNGQRFICWNPNMGSQYGTKLNNFLFLGDSLTVGLNNAVFLEAKGHTVVAAVGASAYQYKGVTTSEVSIGSPSVKVSLTDINNISGIIVMLGTNGVTDANSVDVALDNMKVLLEELRTKYSDIPIYVEKIPPYAKTNSYDNGERQPNIKTYNEKLKELCNSNGYVFIDTLSGLIDSDGYLYADKASSDGLHLNNSGYEILYKNIENQFNSASTGSNVNCIKSSQSSGGYSENYVSSLDKSTETMKSKWLFVMGEANYNEYFDNWTTSVNRSTSDNVWTTKYSNYVQKVIDNDLTVITVKFWDKKDGSWVSCESPIVIHKQLANAVTEIFEILYRLPENQRTPIHDITSGYNYSILNNQQYNCNLFAYGNRGGSSIHNIACCLDINVAENPEVPNGEINNAWNPLTNEYSFSSEDELVKTFELYGFGWGGGWSSKKDYMHFSYLE